MKKLISLFISMMMLFLFACSVDEEIAPDPSAAGQLKAFQPKGAVITVLPSGADDTQALSDAFDAAKAAGSGSLVQMVEGTYTVGTIDIFDFDGYLRGAGKGKTIIKNIPESPCELAWEKNSIPCLLRFINGCVTVSDLTFHMNDGPACASGGTLNDQIYGSDIAAIIVLSDQSGIYLPDDKYIKGVIDNVEFIGGNDGGAGVYATPGNVSMPLYCGGDGWFPTDFYTLTHGDFSVTNCHFELCLVGPDFSGLDDVSSALLVNNVMVDNSLASMYLGTFVGAKCIVKNNILKNSGWADLYIDDYDFGFFSSLASTKRTEFTITGNKFESAPGVISIYLKDYLYIAYSDNHLLPQLFDVRGNTIHTQEGGIAIQGLNNADAKIWNNLFSGTGAVGIMVEGDEATGTYAENIRLMGNNFKNATYTDAAVSLGAYTKNCMVVGVASDLVVDLGVNNKIIGVKAQKKGPHYQAGMHGHLKSMQQSMMKMRQSKPQ